MDSLQLAVTQWGAALGPWGPRLLAVVGLLCVAWIGGRVARGAVTRIGGRAGLDHRLQTPGFSAMLGGVASGIVWLLALPGLLQAMDLQGLLVPVNVMMSRLMGFLPNVAGAAIVLGIGVLAARILRQVVTGLLRAAGSERLAERLGLNASLGEHGLAGLIGSVVFALVMLPVLTAALSPLQIDAVTMPVSRLLESVIALIPKLVAGGAILVIASLLGRAAAGVTTGLLAGMGADRLPQALGLPRDRFAGGRRASEVGGMLVMWSIVLLALLQACEVLGMSALTQAVAQLGVLLAQLVVAAVVLAVGLWLSSLAAKGVSTVGGRHALVLSRMVRWAVLTFTAALALRQAGLPADIVAIAFGAVVGALALGAALALGLGGQHAVMQLSQEWLNRRRVPGPSEERREDGSDR